MSTQRGTIWLGCKNNPKVDAKEYLANYFKLSNASYVCG